MDSSWHAAGCLYAFCKDFLHIVDLFCDFDPVEIGSRSVYVDTDLGSYVDRNEAKQLQCRILQQTKKRRQTFTYD